MFDLTDIQIRQLQNNSRKVDDNCPPVVRLVNEEKGHNWLLWKSDGPQAEDQFYAMHTVKDQDPDVLVVSLSDLKKCGLDITNDTSFTADRAMSVYIDAALHFKSFINDEKKLEFIERTGGKLPSRIEW